LENLLQEDLEPIEKNQLIELYINRINSNRGIYRIYTLNSLLKRTKSSSFSELRKGNLKSLETIIEEGQKVF
jgi:hypothetical protein